MKVSESGFRRFSQGTAKASVFPSVSPASLTAHPGLAPSRSPCALPARCEVRRLSARDTGLYCPVRQKPPISAAMKLFPPIGGQKGSNGAERRASCVCQSLAELHPRGRSRPTPRGLAALSPVRVCQEAPARRRSMAVFIDSFPYPHVGEGCARQETEQSVLHPRLSTAH